MIILSLDEDFPYTNKKKYCFPYLYKICFLCTHKHDLSSNTTEPLSILEYIKFKNVRESY